jgi:hypothetical protein
MVILVCGDRNWNAPELIVMKLIEIQDEPRHMDEGLYLIHGDCRGADKQAAMIAEDLHWTVYAVPAEWEKYGRAAGPKRNQKMIDEYRPSRVIAFHDDIEHSKGTKDMVARAKKAGIPVEVMKHA